MRAVTPTLPAGPWRPVVWRGGRGSPIVFLHGLMGIDGDDKLLHALAAHHEVVAPVAPGFADLAELDDIRDVHDLALAYDDLFAALGLDHADVVGHSFGAMVALELAAHVPHRVGRLVLCAPLGLWDDTNPVADVFAVPLTDVNALLWSDPAAAPDYLRTVVGAATGEEAMMNVLVSVLQGLTTAGKFVWPLPDKGLRRRIHRVRAPALVVWGRDDKMNPVAYADAFVAALGDAKAEIIDGAGHMLPYERVDLFVDLVTSFCA